MLQCRCKFVCVKDNYNGVLLLTLKIFQISSISASPSWFCIYLCILANIFLVHFMCSIVVKCWSNKTPRSLIDFSLCISQLLIIRFGRRREISSFLLGLLKNQCFVFSTFKLNLFAVNQSLMFTSLSFTTVKRCLMLIKDFSRRCAFHFVEIFRLVEITSLLHVIKKKAIEND